MGKGTAQGVQGLSVEPQCVCAPPAHVGRFGGGSLAFVNIALFVFYAARTHCPATTATFRPRCPEARYRDNDRRPRREDGRASGPSNKFYPSSLALK